MWKTNLSLTQNSWRVCCPRGCVLHGARCGRNRSQSRQSCSARPLCSWMRGCAPHRAGRWYPENEPRQSAPWVPLGCRNDWREEQMKADIRAVWAEVVCQAACSSSWVKLETSSSLTVKTNSFKSIEISFWVYCKTQDVLISLFFQKYRDIFLSLSQNTRYTGRISEYRTSAWCKMC